LMEVHADELLAKTPKATADETMLVSVRPQALPLPTLTVKLLPGGETLKGPIKIENFPFVIGRTEGDLNIQEGSISRSHLKITFDAALQKYFVTDLNSKNGTSLNHQPLIPEQPTLIEPGSVIYLGPNVAIHFNY